MNLLQPIPSSVGFAHLQLFNTTLHPILDPMDIMEWSKVLSLTLQYQQWTRSRALLICFSVLSGRLSENSHVRPPGVPRIVERTENGTKHCKWWFYRPRCLDEAKMALNYAKSLIWTMIVFGWGLSLCSLKSSSHFWTKWTPDHHTGQGQDSQKVHNLMSPLKKGIGLHITLFLDAQLSLEPASV